jgi:hypothetical protein
MEGWEVGILKPSPEQERARDLFVEFGMEVTENNRPSTAASSGCLKLRFL